MSPFRDPLGFDGSPKPAGSSGGELLLRRLLPGFDLLWSCRQSKRAPTPPVAPEPKPGDPGSAKAALDRIVIPQDAMDRIAGIAPRSSLIITDEAPSSETGKGTDFVILLSGEPQGGIKIRRRGPGSEFSNARRRDRSPFSGPPFAGPLPAW